jgi:hypothetical protein
VIHWDWILTAIVGYYAWSLFTSLVTVLTKIVYPYSLAFIRAMVKAHFSVASGMVDEMDAMTHVRAPLTKEEYEGMAQQNELF